MLAEEAAALGVGGGSQGGTVKGGQAGSSISYTKEDMDEQMMSLSRLMGMHGVLSHILVYTFLKRNNTAMWHSLADSVLSLVFHFSAHISSLGAR